MFIKVIRIRPRRSELLIPVRAEICLLSETYRPGGGPSTGGGGAIPPFPFRVFIACVGTIYVPEFVPHEATKTREALSLWSDVGQR